MQLAAANPGQVAIPHEPAARSRYDQLTKELDGIVSKRIHDGNWFVIGSEGRLVLEERPSGFALVWEVVSRIFAYLASFFCSGPSALEVKFEALARGLEEYLQGAITARDPQLSLFLNKYTPALNAFFHATGQMHKKGRLSDATHQSLQAVAANKASETYQLVIAPENPRQTRCPGNGAESYHPLQPTSLIVFKNELERAGVTFDIYNPTGTTWQQRTSVKRGETTQIHTLAEGNFETPRDVNQVTATVSQEMRLNDFNCDYTLKFVHSGNIGMQARRGDHVPLERGPQLTFDNRGVPAKPIEVTIEVPGEKSPIHLSIDRNELVQQALPRSVIVAHEEPKITWSYQTNKVDLTLGCKVGRYTCQVNLLGELKIRVEALRKRALPLATFNLLRGNYTVITYSEDGVKVAKPQSRPDPEPMFQFFKTISRELWLQFSLKQPGERFALESKPFCMPARESQMSFPFRFVKAEDFLGDTSSWEAMKNAPELIGEVVMAEEFAPATERFEPAEHKE